MVEIHPFEPWLPGNAKLLMLGTFPPSEKRWCMPWYYPNFQNDMLLVQVVLDLAGVLRRDLRRNAQQRKEPGERLVRLCCPMYTEKW